MTGRGRSTTALDLITATTRAYGEALLAAGADGVFFATQLADTDIVTEEEYREFGRPYDLEVLSGATAAWFNILHVHGTNGKLEWLLDYPIAAINWHVDAGRGIMDVIGAGKSAMGGCRDQFCTVVRPVTWNGRSERQ